MLTSAGKKNAKHKAALLAIILSHFAFNIYWISEDNTNPSWDEVNHFLLSDYAYNSMDCGNAVLAVLSAGSFHPPLVHMASLPAYLLLGESYKTACLSLIFFFGVLLYSTYGIGRRIYGPNVGLAASFLVSMYPAVYGLSRQYFLDMPLAAMVSLSVLSLLEYRENGGMKYVFFFFLSLVLGMLTKTPFILFVAGPIALVSLERIYKKQSLIGLTVALFLSVILFLLWLIPNYAYNASIFVHFLYVLSGQGIARLFQATVLHYLLVLVSLASFPLIILFPIGACLQLISKRDTSLLILLAWILVPYMFLTMAVIDYRYIMPVLPAIAIISASFFPRTLKEAKRKDLALWASVFLLSVSQFAVLSFGGQQGVYDFFVSAAMPVSALGVGTRPLAEYRWLEPEAPYYASKSEYKVYFYRCENPFVLVHPPAKGDWRVAEILDRINNTKNSPEPKVIVIPNTIDFNEYTFRYYEAIQNYEIGLTWIDCPMNQSRLLEYDYVIVKTGYSGIHSLECYAHNIRLCRNSLTDELKEDLLPKYFQGIAEYDLPDGSKAELYQRRRIP